MKWFGKDPLKLRAFLWNLTRVSFESPFGPTGVSLSQPKVVSHDYPLDRHHHHNHQISHQLEHNISLLLQRNEPRTVRRTNTRPTVLDRSVTDTELAQIMTHHLRLDFHLVELLPGVDSAD